MRHSAMCLLDRDGLLVWFSEATAPASGKRREEILGKTFWDLVDDESRDQLRQAIADVIVTDNSHEIGVSICQRRVELNICRAPKRPRVVVTGLYRPNPVALTSREQEVLQLLGRGWRSKRIARFLRCATSTVESHRSRILQKTGSDNGVQLGIWAALHGHA